MTWFWPGHSVETFPEQFDAVVAAGHEIGVDGYSHENPIAMSREFSPVTIEILLERGFLYDHSLMHDFTPYYVRVGDAWTKIDYAAESAKEWMKPLVRGRETDLIEIPASWYLDDLPPMMFIKSSPNGHRFVSTLTTSSPMTAWRSPLFRPATNRGSVCGALMSYARRELSGGQEFPPCGWCVCVAGFGSVSPCGPCRGRRSGRRR